MRRLQEHSTQIYSKTTQPLSNAKDTNMFINVVT